MSTMRKSAVEFKHEQLFAGEVRDIIKLKVSAGTYKRGTLLDSADGLTYKAATTVALTGHFAICAEDVEISGSGEVVTYKHGYFNKDIVEAINTSSIITADAVEILKTQDIFLVDTIEQ